MVDKLLADAGIKGRGSRFLKSPAGTYAVWFDQITAEGADNAPPTIFHHSVSIELYSPKPDPDAETALEEQLAASGLEWEKAPRYWIQTEQLYQVVYDFDYTEKRRIS